MKHYDLYHPSLKCKDCKGLFDRLLDIEVHYRDTKDHQCCCLCNVSYSSRLEIVTVSAISSCVKDSLRLISP